MAGLAAAGRPLAELYDVALLDLDGTVYVGHRGIPGAAGAVAAAGASGLRPVYVTNNAARTPEVVAGQLSSLGLAASADDVVTSAQAGARLVRERFPQGSPAVLVVGGEGLRSAVLGEGMHPVDTATDRPVAVVQGWSPDLGWSLLAEGGYAIAAGAVWVATNTDRTLPTDRGTAPGNGSFVALLAGVVGRAPDAVAGKPEPALLSLAITRSGAVRPLVVGDRLDTDIEAANRAGLPSLLVLTGVTTAEQLVLAVPGQRPTYVAADLNGLLTPHPVPGESAQGWTCGGWVARTHDGVLELVAEADAEPLDGLRAAACACWSAADAGQAVPAAAVGEALAILRPAGSAAAGGP